MATNSEEATTSSSDLLRRGQRPPLLLLLLLLSFTVLAWTLIEKLNLWWDEGWNISIARNFVELGHLGRLISGEPHTSALMNSVPVVFLSAAAIKLFDVGIWQVRLPFLLHATAVLVVLYLLAVRLFDKRVAAASLVILLLMSGHRHINPLFLGVQVIGEMVMIFYLLIGYLFLHKAYSQPLKYLSLAVCAWSIAYITKRQMHPFWVISMLGPLLLVPYHRNFRSAILFLFAGVLTPLLGTQVRSFIYWLLRDCIVWGTALKESEFVIFVPDLSVRMRALELVLLHGAPLLAALCYFSFTMLKTRYREIREDDSHTELIKLSLFLCAGSWCAWYVLFSIGWERYLGPSLYVGVIFCAAMLQRISGDFSFQSTAKKACGIFRPKFAFGHSALAFIVLTACTVIPLLTVKKCIFVFTHDTNDPLRRTVEFLETHGKPDALIETYDSELFFLLNKRYHYPPDQVHVDLNLRYFLGRNVAVDYDPLEAGPDYLVVGPFSEGWGLYDKVLISERTRLIRDFGRYRIYEVE